eukprot:7604612-Pyramimonas_sp.AAC.1
MTVRRRRARSCNEKDSIGHYWPLLATIGHNRSLLVTICHYWPLTMAAEEALQLRPLRVGRVPVEGRGG